MGRITLQQCHIALWKSGNFDSGLKADSKLLKLRPYSKRPERIFWYPGCFAIQCLIRNTNRHYSRPGGIFGFSVLGIAGHKVFCPDLPGENTNQNRRLTARCVMAKLSLLFLLLGSLYAAGQNPPSLDLYTSATNHFSFVYPDKYDLLEGEGILKRTQGKHMGIPDCDLLTAVACVIYPADNLQDSGFEAAVFSVNDISKGLTEQDCLGFADQLPRAGGEQLAIQMVRLNGQLFQYASTTATLAGHSQFTQRYRSFHEDRCYELRIAISVSDLALAQSPSKTVLDNEDAKKAHQSLELILSSFVVAN